MYMNRKSMDMARMPMARSRSDVDDEDADNFTNYSGYDESTCANMGTFCGTICTEAAAGLGECCVALGVCAADLAIRLCTPCIDRHIDPEDADGDRGTAERWLLWLNPYSYTTLSTASLADDRPVSAHLRFATGTTPGGDPGAPWERGPPYDMAYSDDDTGRGGSATPPSEATDETQL